VLDAMLQEMYPNISIAKLNIYKSIAIDKLLNYFRNQLFIPITEQELETEYMSALFLFISNAIDFEKMKGIKSIKQGNKQVAYNTYDAKQFVITKELMDMFPLPRVRAVEKIDLGKAGGGNV